jgi:hypothetical protein
MDSELTGAGTREVTFPQTSSGVERVSVGLDVRLFDTRRYMFGTAAEMNDSAHLNVADRLS